MRTKLILGGMILILILGILIAGCLNNIGGNNQNYTLTVTIDPPGSGMITPSGGSYKSGQVVTLTIDPATGYEFDHWGGDIGNAPTEQNTLTITMDRNRNITGFFRISDSNSKYMVNVGVYPNLDAGAVFLEPSLGPYDPGSQVTVTAIAEPGWRFDCWEGDASGSNQSINVNLDSHKQIIARFVEEILPSIGKIQFGFSSIINGETVQLSTIFTDVPYVFVTTNGVAAATNITSSDFTIAISNPNCMETYGYSAWIAIDPDPSGEIKAGKQTTSDNQEIFFDEAFETPPVVICSAESGGSPLLAAAINVTTTGFTISLKDLEGNSASGNLQYLALPPFPNCRYFITDNPDYTTIALWSGKNLWSNACMFFVYSLGFIANAAVGSASKNSNPCITYLKAFNCPSVFNKTGFEAFLKDYDLNSVSEADLDWIAFSVN